MACYCAYCTKLKEEKMGEKKQWVQHVSGQGQKWELDDGSTNSDEGKVDWCVRSKVGHTRHWLPKSEYLLCDPPERWVDVSSECSVKNGVLYHKRALVEWDEGYRPSEVTFLKNLPGTWVGDIVQSAFIIEKKVPS